MIVTFINSYQLENRNLLIAKNKMSQQGSIKKRKTRSISSFLKKTYDILENQQNHSIVKWSNDGIGFVVIKQQQFSKQILPRYFKHSNYSSFVRQLNMYNFHKLRQTNNQSHFYHQFLRRDNRFKYILSRELLSQIKRKPEKKKKKLDGQQSQEDEKSIISMKKHIKTNKNFSTDSIKIKSWKQQQKKGFEHTRHAFVSEKQQKYQSREKISIQNILSADNEQDKISINNQLGERFPRYPTKQMFYPSSNNIYPFPMKGTVISHYNLFF